MSSSELKGGLSSISSGSSRCSVSCGGGSSGRSSSIVAEVVAVMRMVVW